MILIGENGTGKTSLLRSIAIGLADAKDTSGLLAEDSTGQLVTEGASHATIVITVSDRDGRDTKKLTTVIRSEDGQDVLLRKDSEEDFAFGLVCGYGIGRATQGPDQPRGYRILDSVYTLFRYDDGLISTELILRRLRDFLKKSWYPQVMDKIKEALGLPSDVTIGLPRGGGVRVSGPKVGNNIPLEGWADGYRMTFAWVLDVYHWALRANCINHEGDVTGLVLIDELEQHLHPSMQIDLPARLNKLLPNVQIIATTHSPLVALGAEPEELVVLKRNGDIVQAHDLVRDFRGYSIEDMLADEKLFDSRVYGPRITQKLDRYHELIKNELQRSQNEDDELKTLGSELTSYGIPEASTSSTLKELQMIIEKYNL